MLFDRFPQPTRRILSILFVAGCTAAGGWAVPRIVGPDPIAPGDAIPAIRYTDDAGHAATLAADARHPTAVVLFHSRCGHCHYQLDALAWEVERLAGARLYLLTTEASLPTDSIARRWAGLDRAANVRWGRVEADEFRAAFGGLSTPATFLFDRRGRFLRAFVGEVRVPVVAEVLAGRRGRDPLGPGGRCAGGAPDGNASPTCRAE